METTDEVRESRTRDLMIELKFELTSYLVESDGDRRVAAAAASSGCFRGSVGFTCGLGPGQASLLNLTAMSLLSLPVSVNDQ